MEFEPIGMEFQSVGWEEDEHVLPFEEDVDHGLDHRESPISAYIICAVAAFSVRISTPMRYAGPWSDDSFSILISWKILKIFSILGAYRLLLLSSYCYRMLHNWSQAQLLFMLPFRSYQSWLTTWCFRFVTVYCRSPHIFCSSHCGERPLWCIYKEWKGAWCCFWTRWAHYQTAGSEPANMIPSIDCIAIHMQITTFDWLSFVVHVMLGLNFMLPFVTTYDQIQSSRRVHQVRRTEILALRFQDMHVLRIASWAWISKKELFSLV